MKKSAWGSISELSFILGTILAISSILISMASPGDGSFQPSIYLALPGAFWALVGLTGLLGILTSTLEVFVIRKGYRWVWGTLLLMVLAVFLLLQPYLFDYAFHGQYDTVVHYSWSLEISEYGVPAAEDFYPLAHFWASLLANTAGITVQQSILILPAIMYLVGISCAFILAWSIDTRPEVRGLITTMLALPVFSFFQSMFYPLQMGIYLLWLFLAFFIRTRTRPRTVEDSLIFILILFAIPFIHPLAVIAALLAIASYYVTLALKNANLTDGQTVRSLVESFIAPFIMLFASWFTWFSSFRAFGISVGRIFQAIVEELSGQRFTDRYSNVLEGADRSLAEVSRLAVFIHGPTLLYTIIALAAVILILRKRDIKEATGFLVVNIAAFLGIGVLSLAIDLIAETPQRYLNYAVAIIPAFAAPILITYSARLTQVGRALLVSALSLVLTAAFGLGVFNLFFSDIVRETNHQFSFAQLSGYDFLLAYASDEEGNIFSPIRGAQSIFALEPYNDVINRIKDSPNWRMAFAPPHFGYSAAGGEPIQKFFDPQYLVITEFERNLFQLGPQLELFTPEDFMLLDEDLRWNLVYDSGDFELRAWRTEGSP